MKPFGVASLFLIFCLSVTAESLWNPDFTGYLSGTQGFSKGDAVIVQIDASSALSFSSSSNDSKSFTLTFSGGEAGNLFSFLPEAGTGDALSAKGSEQYSLRADVAAVVSEIDAAGRGLVQGSRSISIDGKEESVSVSGWVSPRDVGPQARVPFTRIADAKLLYKTFLTPSQPVLTDGDIQQIIAAGPAPETNPTGAATGTAGATASAQSAQTLALTDTKKKELLLLYINRLIDILFSK
jgi:flagellar L-ring protein precursor FlgH